LEGEAVADTMEEVKRIISKFAKNKEALATATAETRIRKDLGVSSANLVDVVLEFEDAFNLTIADDELTKITWWPTSFPSSMNRMAWRSRSRASTVMGK
jgi:acyl carrier protein